MKKFLFSVLFATQVFATILGMEFGKPYYIQAGDGRGYLNKYKSGFVIANGLRTQFIFEAVKNSKNKVFIKVLPERKYLSVSPDGFVFLMDRPLEWEQFQVSVSNREKYSFRSTHGNYLMAALNNMSVSVSPNLGPWENFSLIPVRAGEKKFGFQNIKDISAKYSRNEYVKRQEEYIDFLSNSKVLKARTTPNIYIIILDTMRADFVNHETGPNLLEFKQDSVYTDIALSGSTTTNPSLFSLYSARPSYEFYANLASEITLGSMPLNILKYKLGYQIKITGVKDMTCLDVRPPRPYFAFSPEAYLAVTELRFGFKTHLIDDCAKTGLIGNEDFAHADTAKLNEKTFNHLLQRIENSPQSQTIFIAHLQGAHEPYNFSQEDSLAQNVLQLESARRYGSTFRQADRNFGRFIKQLKSKDLYENALIIVMGDHGEVLIEDADKNVERHGGYPIDRAQTRVPLYFKFPGNDNHKFKKLTKVSTLADVFPTIFDYLGALTSEQIEDFFTGRSLRDLRTHVVPINRVNPDNIMAFFAYPYRLNVKYKPEEYHGPYSLIYLENLSANDFEVETLENFDDQSILVKPTIEINPDSLSNFKTLFPGLFRAYQKHGKR